MNLREEYQNASDKLDYFTSLSAENKKELYRTLAYGEQKELLATLPFQYLKAFTSSYSKEERKDIYKHLSQNQIQALYNTSNEEEQKEIRKAIKKYKPNSILILGTSDDMVKKIAENLGLPEVEKTIYISDIATKEEMDTAKRIRTTEGKHVIPVPTFEIKKDFSGYILDPLQIFKTKGRGKDPYISEKSIIRPTFSYLGNFTISDTVFRQIAEHLASKTDFIDRIIKTRVDKLPEGPYIYMEVIVNYGYNLVDGLKDFKEKTKKEIEKLTTMNIQKIDIVAKGIKVKEDNKEEK